MGILKTQSQSPSREVAGKRATAPKTQTQTAHCLVASASQEKRSFLSDAATQAGWDTVVCADAQNATAAARRVKFQMAWIDLDHGGKTPSGFRDLCQTLAATPEMLLAVCGHVSDPQEEVWARQLGVWLYLPGISIDHLDEISQLCEHAQLLAQGPKASY